MSGSGPVDTRVLAYAESPFERIVDVHWKVKPPDGGGGEPPEDLPPCGDLTLTPGGEGIFVGISIVHVNLGAVASATGEGVWIQPTDMPPVDWTQIGPPTWDYEQKGNQIYVPGNGATSVDITVTFHDVSQWWVRPGTAWTDPSIWNTKPSGGIDFFSPAGPPTGTGTSFSITVDKTPLKPSPDNPNNFGTTLQFVSVVTHGSITMTVAHNNCPEGAPSEVPPHP